MNTQEKIQQKVLEYLKFNFGNCKFILNKKLFDGQDGVEIYGFSSIKVLVKELGKEVQFLPVFNK